MWNKWKTKALGLLWLFALILELVDGQRKAEERNFPRLVMCDVGQGDAILVTQDDKQMLIDGGPDALVLHCLEEEMPYNDKVIEKIILTHTDLDHFGGLIEVLKRYQVKEIVLDNLGKESAEFEDFFNLLQLKQKNEGLKISSPVMAQTNCETKSICWQVLWHSQQVLPGNIFSYKNTFEDLSDMLKKIEHKNIDYNNGSIVIKMQIEDKNFLLAGDIAKNTELAMIGSGLLKKIDGLKVPHHGSKLSSTLDFLTILQPEISLISCGQDNNFGHPGAETLERLQAINSTVLRTDLLGKVVLIVKNGELIYETEKKMPGEKN